ncbi:MAG: DMT family transporter [Candidatus Portiera sp.]|nr:DMT family transporter [Portiera sp.]
MKLHQWLLLLFVASLWATSFTAMEIGLTEVNPSSVIFWRMWPGALLTLAVVLGMGYRFPRHPKFWFLAAITGAVSHSLPFVLIASGQQYIEAGLAAIFNSALPISTTILAHFFVRNETLNRFKTIGLILGFIGIAIIFGKDSLQEFDLRSFGQVLVLLATICYAVGLIFGKALLATAKSTALPDGETVHPFVICAACMVCGALWMFPMVYLLDGELQVPQTLGVWGPLMFMSIFGTGVAFLVYYHLLSQVETTKVAMVTFIIPPIAILVGWVMLGEVLSPNMYLGMLIIFLGLMFLDGRIKPLLRLLKINIAD